MRERKKTSKSLFSLFFYSLLHIHKKNVNFESAGNWLQKRENIRCVRCRWLLTCWLTAKNCFRIYFYFSYIFIWNYTNNMMSKFALWFYSVCLLIANSLCNGEMRAPTSYKVSMDMIFRFYAPKNSSIIKHHTCPTYTSASRDGNSVLIVASDIKEVPHLRNLLIENWKHTMYNLSTTTTTQSRAGIYSYIDPSGEWEGEAEGLSVNNSLYVDVPFDLQFNVNARIIR